MPRRLTATGATDASPQTTIYYEVLVPNGDAAATLAKLEGIGGEALLAQIVMRVENDPAMKAALAAEGGSIAELRAVRMTVSVPQLGENVEKEETNDPSLESQDSTVVSWSVVLAGFLLFVLFVAFASCASAARAASTPSTGPSAIKRSRSRPLAYEEAPITPTSDKPAPPSRRAKPRKTKPTATRIGPMGIPIADKTLESEELGMPRV